jgi:hypothetical protein
MIKGYLLRVRRNESVTIEAAFPAWERHILESVHPETSIVREVLMDRAAPSAEEEFVRLENRYRQTTNEDGSKGSSFVAAIYGHANGGGIPKLQAAIDEATVAGEPAGEVEALLGEATA